MVSRVQVAESSWLGLPQRFEAGTPPIASAIGLSAALKYMTEHVDFDILKSHEAFLCKQLIDGLMCLKNVTIYGPVDQLKKFGHIVSFNIQGIHPHDVAAYCDRFGICIRAGLHCAHPLAEHLGIGPSVRVSLFAYNTDREIEQLLKILEQLMDEMRGYTCISGCCL